MKTLILFFISTLMLATTQAIEVGDTCYSKKKATELLSQPDRASEVASKVPWGTELKVKAVQGRWLQVSSAKGKGWVFIGNISEDSPIEENNNDFLPTAGDTGAAIAARPLSPAAEKYSERKDEGASAEDVQWMERQADAISSKQLAEFQKMNQLGEYAP